MAPLSVAPASAARVRARCAVLVDPAPPAILTRAALCVARVVPGRAALCVGLAVPGTAALCVGLAVLGREARSAVLVVRGRPVPCVVLAAPACL
ncbi:hypothetical protein, partial [Paractinoplanes deccanensis]|uniref:hypothetical protein n=1 Tax=Paractinoplanes deccanensis TaxID=113561 RepID=UPI0019421028